MSDPFVAEIRIFAGNFAPRGWARCDGQLLPIVQNTALFSLLGTIYGGDGRSTFALPNLQDRVPMHHGQGPGLTERFLGEDGGQATVTLISSEMPVHSHSAPVAAASSANPANMTWGAAIKGGTSIYSTTYGSGAAMSPMAVGTAGSSQPHNNMQPYLAFTFIIAMQGIYPSRG